MNLRLRSWSVGVIALGLVAAALAAAPAEAVTYCRTDPTVTLSNGTQLTIYADTYTTLSQIKSVNYQLHVPTGVSLTNVTYDQFGYLEHLSVYADQEPGRYRIEYQVNDVVSAPVYAYATATGFGLKSDDTSTNDGVHIDFG